MSTARTVPAASITFVNEKSFIQVRNATNDVVVFLNKASLLIQKDSATSFLLKNDTYVGYYLYNTVVSPATADINELVRILVTWVEEDGGVTPGTILNEIRTNYKASSSNDLLEKASAGASSSYVREESLRRMDAAETQQTRIVRQSREYIPASFVSEIIVVIQAALAEATATTDILSRVGVFEDQADIDPALTVTQANAGRGAFFQYDFANDELSVNLRENVAGTQSDTKIVPADFNIDPFDGTGPSQFTLNATDLNLFVLNWDPVTKLLRMGVLVADRAYYCHEFGRGATVIQKLNAPIRWEISQVDFANASTAPAAAAAMFQGKASVFHRDDPTVSTSSIDAGIERKTVGTEEILPIFSLRVQEESNRAKLVAKKLTILNTSSTGVARWELVTNSTLTDETFEAVPNSFAEFSRTETASTGGNVVATGFLINAGLEEVDLEKSGIYVSSFVDGTPETLTLRIQNISGVVEILGSIDWYERE